MKKHKVIVFGGTGFIGQCTMHYLTEKGFDVTAVARNKPQEFNYPLVLWDGKQVADWKYKLENAHAIINLVGKSVDCIKTPENQDEILRSRIDSVNLIGEALNQINHKPLVWIQMSTAHIYGDSETRTCHESSPTGYGFAPFVGKAWEEAFHEAKPPETRGVILRTTFVIGKTGGAMNRLKHLVRLGLGGVIGKGSQGISWIHSDDLSRFIHYAIKNHKVSGVFNMTTPNPVSQKAFMQKMRRSMKVLIGLPAPACLTRIGAFLLFKSDAEMILYGRYVISQKFDDVGFKLKYKKLEEALEQILR